MKSTASSELLGIPVAVVVNSFLLGGAEREALLISNYLRKDYQAKAVIFGFRPIGLLAELCQIQHIPYQILPKPPITYTIASWPGAAFFAWFLRRSRIQIVLSFTTYPNLISSLAWRWGGAKLCIWNQLDEGKGLKGRRIEKWAFRRVSCFAVNSRTGFTVLENIGITPEKIRIIPSGIELNKPQKTRQTWRKQLNLTEDIFIACMVATLSKYKDHETLLKAWRIVIDEAPTPSPHLLLVGRLSDSSSYLINLSHDLGINSVVHFLGEEKDVAGLLNAVDLGLYSSASEGLPNAILEYMAAGLPLIATDLPGVRMAIGTNCSNCLVPVGNAKLMAIRILEFLNNSTLRNFIAIENRKRIDACFTPEIMTDKMVRWILENLPRKT
jgi:glycosyltransferase involved in cell wall biosynthesis